MGAVVIGVVGAEAATAAGLRAGAQSLAKNSGEIGRNIIRWGRGQGADDVAQTVARIGEMSPKAVREMMKQGLERSWVEKQLSLYEKAVGAAGKKLTNEQLLPRLELMQTILRNWPK